MLILFPKTIPTVADDSLVHPARDELAPVLQDDLQHVLSAPPRRAEEHEGERGEQELGGGMKVFELNDDGNQVLSECNIFFTFCMKPRLRSLARFV